MKSQNIVKENTFWNEIPKLWITSLHNIKSRYYFRFGMKKVRSSYCLWLKIPGGMPASNRYFFLFDVNFRNAKLFFHL